MPFIWKVKHSFGSISIFLLEVDVLTDMLKFFCCGECESDAVHYNFVFLKYNVAMLSSPIITPLNPMHNKYTCLANSEFDQKWEVYLCDKQTYNLSILNCCLLFLQWVAISQSLVLNFAAPHVTVVFSFQSIVLHQKHIFHCDVDLCVFHLQNTVHQIQQEDHTSASHHQTPSHTHTHAPACTR